MVAADAAGEDDDPSAEVLIAMVEELLDAYTAPQFQSALEEMRAECVRNKLHPLLAMGPLTLTVQAPILEKHGLAPDSRGVDRMKHAVERRVAEGHVRLGDLANQARGALGLQGMPRRGCTAEHVLSAKLDETWGRLGLPGGPVAGGSTEVLVLVAKQCKAQLLKDTSLGLVSKSACSFIEGMLDEDPASVPQALSLHKMAKIGVLASQLQGEGPVPQVPVLHQPDAAEFFEACVLPNRPAVLRGAVTPADFPPLADFPRAEYLRGRCGGRRVPVKSLSHVDGSGRPVFVTDPELRMPFGAFLDGLQAHEDEVAKQPFYLGKVPLRKELPELADDVDAAEGNPRRVFESCFGDLIPQGVFTYFGCGGNTTPVHWDAHENLLLCVCGTKKLLLYPPSDARYLYPCNDFTRSAALPFRQLPEYPSDLREKFASVSRASPVEVHLQAGDLLYLPACWWHCVEGSQETNMILNWWFALHPDKKRRGLAST